MSTEQAPLPNDAMISQVIQAVDLAYRLPGGTALFDILVSIRAKITSGELMVGKTTNMAFGGEFSCQQCHFRLFKAYNWCPGCGAKIIP